MKAYAVTIVVVDHEGMGQQAIEYELSNARHAYGSVLKTVEADIGDWSDSHPLNHRGSFHATATKLFEGKQ